MGNFQSNSRKYQVGFTVCEKGLFSSSSTLSYDPSKTSFEDIKAFLKNTL